MTFPFDDTGKPPADSSLPLTSTYEAGYQVGYTGIIS